MKDPMLKLYAQTPPKALAVLAVGAMLRLDAGEHERILSAVPKATYQMNDADFMGRCRALMNIAHMWSLSYWRILARQLICNGFVLAHPDMPEHEAARHDDAAAEAASMLKALDAALDAFAAETGLDAAAVRQWAGSLEPGSEPLTEAEQAGVRELLEGWRGLL